MERLRRYGGERMAPASAPKATSAASAATNNAIRAKLGIQSGHGPQYCGAEHPFDRVAHGSTTSLWCGARSWNRLERDHLVATGPSPPWNPLVDPRVGVRTGTDLRRSSPDHRD